MNLLELHPLLSAGIAAILGIAGLVWGADRFVSASANIAHRLGISSLIIGLTIVAFGTSAPEVMVSISAAIDGAGEIAIGNAIGSNLANIGLVLGTTLLLTKIALDKATALHEMPILLAISVCSGFILFDGTISLIEAMIMLAMLIPVMGLFIFLKKGTSAGASDDAKELLDDANQAKQRSLAFYWMIFAIGLVALAVSAEILVWGATKGALYFGVDPLIIGLTAVAIGTSLPELAASVTSVLKGHTDIAVGNIIGSNIFNLLAVMTIRRQSDRFSTR